MERYIKITIFDLNNLDEIEYAYNRKKMVLKNFIFLKSFKLIT